MVSLFKRPVLRLALAATTLAMAGLALSASAAPVCDSDNGGITLPAGFCALVVANNLGTARHLVVASNGDLYIALQSKPGGVVALHDSTGNGHFDVKESFGTGSNTGIAIHDGYLYLAQPEQVIRYKLTPGQLKPASDPEVVVKGLVAPQEHHDKGLTFDDKGFLYINVGTPSNACQSRDRQKGVPGMDPCPILETHGGVWKFDANKLNQTQADGVRLVTGIRQEPAITWHDGSVYIVMNNRDQLDTLWPGKFTAEDNATRPTEPMYRTVQGQILNFGWPYCFFDYLQQKLVLNPEYGGDGKTVGRCSQFALPIETFPAHWAPMDVMFYHGRQFPAKYRGGAFIAFHGSWNRAPLPQAPGSVVFLPFAKDKPSGKFEVFASGFAGKSPLVNPAEAAARPNGVAEGLDGSLYITDSQKGKVWRVLYRGEK